MTPKISIIVPVYNTAKYLPQCLDSLIGQTFKDVEIVCVDDGSTDNSAQVIHDYVKKDGRIRYIHQENAGLSEARNTGLDAVKTPYLMFCDSDDWYDTTMCQKMYDAITQNDVDFACCGVKMEYEISNPTSQKADTKYYRIKWNGIQHVTKEAWKKMDCSSCNKIFKKELLNKYHLRYPNGLIYEDFCFFFELLTVSKKMYCLPEYLYHYRRNDESIMVNTFRQNNTKVLDHIKIMFKIYEFLNQKNLFKIWKTTFYDAFLKCFMFSYNWLPDTQKEQAFDLAVPFMEKLNPDLALLSHKDRKLWQNILDRSFCLYKKEIKFFGLRIVKIKRQTDKCSIFFLGIQIYSRKIKKGKETFSILYVPFFKRRIKHV